MLIPAERERTIELVQHLQSLVAAVRFAPSKNEKRDALDRLHSEAMAVKSDLAHIAGKVDFPILRFLSWCVDPNGESWSNAIAEVYQLRSIAIDAVPEGDTPASIPFPDFMYRENLRGYIDVSPDVLRRIAAQAGATFARQQKISREDIEKIARVGIGWKSPMTRKAFQMIYDWVVLGKAPPHQADGKPILINTQKSKRRRRSAGRDDGAGATPGAIQPFPGNGSSQPRG